jgi:hypothetical protein
MVVPVAHKVALQIIVYPQHFGVLMPHPSRPRARGRGKYGIYAVIV